MPTQKVLPIEFIGTAEITIISERMELSMKPTIITILMVPLCFALHGSEPAHSTETETDAPWKFNMEIGAEQSIYTVEEETSDDNETNVLSDPEFTVAINGSQRLRDNNSKRTVLTESVRFSSSNIEQFKGEKDEFREVKY